MVVALAVVLVGAAAGAVLLGVVQPGGDQGPTGEAPTRTPTGTATTAGGDQPSAPPLELSIVAVEPCGQTCRDVTARLVNNQDREATGVTVRTRIHAGTSTEGQVVWEGTTAVGTLGPGETEQETQRVELGLMEAAAVQGADGEITIVTTIETDRRTLQVVERRDVT